MEKLKSRKLWCSILGATMVIVGHEFGVPRTVLLYAVGILGVYIGVEGTIDVIAVLKALPKK